MKAQTDRSIFADLLIEAIIDAWKRFRNLSKPENPYAFALVGSPGGGFLGYAIATEQGLKRVAAKYYREGYRYQGHDWERIHHKELIAEWLRWANPDDGWFLGEFAKKFKIGDKLEGLVDADEFGDDADGLEEFLCDTLARLREDPRWIRTTRRTPPILGFTHGSDPRDFLRVATRCNPYPVVRHLWGEFWRVEYLSDRIKRHDKPDLAGKIAT